MKKILQSKKAKPKNSFRIFWQKFGKPSFVKVGKFVNFLWQKSRFGVNVTLSGIGGAFSSLWKKGRAVAKVHWKKVANFFPTRKKVTALSTGTRAWLIVIVLITSMTWWLNGFVLKDFEITKLIPLSYLWWGLGILAGLTVAWLVKSLVTRSGKTWKSFIPVPPMWLLTILSGVGVFHWLFWATKPELWNAWFQSRIFWPMNIAIILAMFLISQKGGIAKFIGWSLATSVLVFGIIAHKPKAPSGNGLERASIQQQSAPITGRQTQDVVLSIIGGCESGDGTPGSGRQFDANGVLMKNPKSTAIGKYGIMASIHEARAKSFGYDIRTEEGQEGYARLLLSESWTFNWTQDPISRACWETKLLAIGGSARNAFTTFTVIAQTEKWTEKIYFPSDLGLSVWWETQRKNGCFSAETPSDVFNFKPHASDTVWGAIPWARFKALCGVPEKILVKIY